MPMSSSDEDNPSRSRHGDTNPTRSSSPLVSRRLVATMLANQSTSPMVRGPAEARPPTLQGEEAPSPSALGPCTPPPEAEKPCPRHKKTLSRSLTCATVGPGKLFVERLRVEKKHPASRLLSPFMMPATYVPPSPEHAGDEDDEPILHPFPPERHATVAYMFHVRPHESPHD